MKKKIFLHTTFSIFAFLSIAAGYAITRVNDAFTSFTAIIVQSVSVVAFKFTVLFLALEHAQTRHALLVHSTRDVSTWVDAITRFTTI